MQTRFLIVVLIGTLIVWYNVRTLIQEPSPDVTSSTEKEPSVAAFSYKKASQGKSVGEQRSNRNLSRQLQSRTAMESFLGDVKVSLRVPEIFSFEAKDVERESVRGHPLTSLYGESGNPKGQLGLHHYGGFAGDGLILRFFKDTYGASLSKSFLGKVSGTQFMSSYRVKLGTKKQKLDAYLIRSQAFTFVMVLEGDIKGLKKIGANLAQIGKTFRYQR